MSDKVGFIGCGNMGGALIKGFVSSEQVASKDIYVTDKNKEKVELLAHEYGVASCVDAKELAKAVDFIILAVKPDMIAVVLEEVGADIIKNKILISIAAGVTIKSIKKSIGLDCRVVRVMPNTPALVGEGLSAICYGDSIKDEEKHFIKQLFKSVGKVVEIEEKHMNAITALSGSSPAYVFMFIEAMADAAVRMGITRDMAFAVAAQTVLGAAKMVLETGKHPGQLKDMVCSPSGTTIEAVYQLEKRGFRGTIMKAMGECFEKAEEMSKEMGE